MDKERIKNAVKEFLYAIGENPQREGLLETPDRIAKMCDEIFYGLDNDPKDEIKIFNEKDNEGIVVVKNIPLYSLCEHHLLPFFGTANIAYIPKDGVVLGLSKIARVVDCNSKKLQLQERLTNAIADSIQDAVNPKGVAVLIEAEHLCMAMRGIRKPGSKTVTISHRGVISQNSEIRAEVLNLIR